MPSKNPAAVAAATRRWRERNREHVRAYNREWIRRNPVRSRAAQSRYAAKLGKERVRERRLATTYGLSPSAFSDLLAAQNGVCAICGERSAKVVDHDHASGKVRGLLCNSCNLGIGWLGDNAAKLRLALAYLSRE